MPYLANMGSLVMTIAFLAPGLCDQHPIEWVTVMKRHASHARNVIEGNREYIYTKLGQEIRDVFRCLSLPKLTLIAFPKC